MPSHSPLWGDGDIHRRMLNSSGQADHGEARADHNALYGSEPRVKFYTHISDRWRRSIQKLAFRPQNAQAKTVREIGCIDRTVFTLDWIADPALRRRTMPD